MLSIEPDPIIYAGWAAAAAVAWRELRSIDASRIGLSTNHPISAAAMFITAATTNTACQLPVLATSTLDNGTSSDAVPFAV